MKGFEALPKNYFILGLHCHQPVGNFGFVFEENFKMAYEPFIEMMKKFDRIKVALHYSGPLLEWAEENNPEFLNNLASFSSQERIEIISGGFYEPILPAIPRWDALGQIKYMNGWIFERFGVKPKGLWLAERAWEPHLPSLLYDAGMNFTFLDDFHFFGAGVAEDRLGGYHVSEDQNKKINVFPISKDLRYAIPFHQVEEAVRLVKSAPKNLNGDSLAVLFDDGEKFGTWPGTFQHVYTGSWLENFFRAISEDPEIEMILPSQAVAKLSPAGLTYFPACSYFELTQWCLPTEARIDIETFSENVKKNGNNEKYEGFLRGGFWRNYLSKYPESNQLNKRVALISESSLDDDCRPDEKRKCIWRAQCNCGYWHGIFGGIYLPHLRESLYKNLLSAEKIHFAETKEGSDWSKLSAVDINSDGRDELLYHDSKITAVIDPFKGGMITELSDRDVMFNFANCLTRKEEAYHRHMKTLPEDNDSGVATIHDKYLYRDRDAAQFLYFDTDSQGIFFDLVSLGKENEDPFRDGVIFDSRKSFRDCSTKKEGDNWIFDFEKDMTEKFSIKNTKILTANSKRIMSFYSLENLSDACLYFRCYICLLVPEAFSEKRRFSFGNGEKSAFPGDRTEFNGNALKFTDEVVGSVLTMSSSVSADWLLTPAYSVNLSESGFEKNMQSVIISAGRWFCEDRKEEMTVEININNWR